MSFWSKLGKGLAIGGSALATGLTGGAAAPLLMKSIGGALGGGAGAATSGLGGVLSQVAGASNSLSPILGNLAAGRAKGQQTEAGIRSDALQQEFMNKMLLDKINAERPGLRANQAVQGDILANAQDFQVNGPSRVMSHVLQTSGGLRPSMLSAGTRQLGRDMSANAASSMGHENLPTAPDWHQSMPSSNILDQILGVAGPATSLMGAFHNTVGQPPQAATPPLVPPLAREDYNPLKFRGWAKLPSFRPGYGVGDSRQGGGIF